MGAADRAAEGAAEPQGALRDPVLVALLGLALALRAGLLLRYPDNVALGDEIIHYVTGVLAAHFGSGVFGMWGPGYDALLASVFRVAGPDPFWARSVQVVVSTATVALVYDLARAQGSRRAGRIAAALFALDPTLVAYTHYLFSETLFVALIVAAAWALFRRGEVPTRGDCVVAGLCFGAATLTRSVGFYFLPLWIGISLLRGRRPEATRAAIVFGVCLAVVLPWTLRNAEKYEGLLLVDGTLGRTAYFAFSDVFYNQDLGWETWRSQPRERPECRVGDAPGLEPLPPVGKLAALFPPGMYGLQGKRPMHLPIARTREAAHIDYVAYQRCELANALDFARREPEVVAASGARRVYALWGPNSFLLRWSHEGIYAGGPFGRETYPFWKWVVILVHVATIGAGILLFARRPLPAFAGWSALFIGYYTAIHVVAVAHSRYRLPLMPFVIVLAALFLAAPERPKGPRGMATILGVVGFALLCGVYVAERLP